MQLTKFYIMPSSLRKRLSRFSSGKKSIFVSKKFVLSSNFLKQLLILWFRFTDSPTLLLLLLLRSPLILLVYLLRLEV